MLGSNYATFVRWDICVAIYMYGNNIQVLTMWGSHLRSLIAQVAWVFLTQSIDIGLNPNLMWGYNGVTFARWGTML